MGKIFPIFVLFLTPFLSGCPNFVYVDGKFESYNEHIVKDRQLVWNTSKASYEDRIDRLEKQLKEKEEELEEEKKKKF